MFDPSATARTLINGHSDGVISPFDRGFAFGDGLFETIAVRQGAPRLWQAHCERLERGCRALDLPAPERGTLAAEVEQARGADLEGTVRITITRGVGPRGYAPPPAPVPTRVVTFHPGQPRLPERPLTLRWCDTRLGLQPELAGLKHLNRLDQVRARAEWSDPEVDEGIVLSVDGRVIECVAANLFVVREGVLITAELSDCGVAGVVRRQVLDTAAALSIETEVRDVGAGEVKTADEIFVTNSVRGIAPVGALEGRHFPAPGPVTEHLIHHSDWLT